MKKPIIKPVNDTSIHLNGNKEKPSIVGKIHSLLFPSNKDVSGTTDSSSNELQDTENQLIIKTRVSTDFPINFETLTPKEKLEVGISASIKDSKWHKLKEHRLRSKQLDEQNAKINEAISLINQMLNAKYGENPSGVSKCIIFIKPSHQIVVPHIKGYFPGWKVTKIGVNSTINTLLPLPIAILFRKRVMD